MAEEYVGVSPDGVRPLTDPGNAKVLDGKGTSVPSGMGWSDLAYTAGGGALGYLLSKWIMGDDDDEDGKGKKRSGGFLKSIVPWLGAVAGAYGGHYLSGSGNSGRGTKNEVALKKDKNGNIVVPDRPASGRNAHADGNWLAFLGGPALGARGLANWSRDRVSNKRDLADRFRQKMFGASPSVANAYRDEIGKLTREADKIESARSVFSVRHPIIGGIRNGTWLGKGYHGNSRILRGILNSKGNFATAILAELAALGAHAMGTGKNRDLRAWKKTVDKLKSEGLVSE